jgi:hypothetical protein
MTRTTRRWLFPVLAVAVAAGAALQPVATAQTAGTRPATGPAGGGAGGGGRAPTAADKAAAQQHFQKAKDLFYTQNKPEEAAVENDQALALDPTLFDAQLLKSVIQNKLAGGGTGGTGGGTVAGGGGGKMRTLTPAQISVIRLLEMPADDTRIRGSIPRNVLQEFWEVVATKEPTADTSRPAYEAFISPNNFAAQAHRIRDAGNQKYIEQVTVNSDPANLIAFRNTIHTYVLQNCATADCHGGDKPGGGGATFRLLNGANNDATVYTNFYIMSMYTAKSGGRMIDRNNPDRSLFLQYSLPKNIAMHPHPGKVDVRRLANSSDQRFKAMSDWVGSLALPMPNYHIAYEIPGMGGAPATAPAATPPATPPGGR